MMRERRVVGVAVNQQQQQQQQPLVPEQQHQQHQHQHQHHHDNNQHRKEIPYFKLGDITLGELIGTGSLCRIEGIQCMRYDRNNNNNLLLNNLNKKKQNNNNSRPSGGHPKQSGGGSSSSSSSAVATAAAAGAAVIAAGHAIALDSHLYVIKRPKVSTNYRRSLKDIQREINILREIGDHNFIISLHGIDIDKKFIILNRLQTTLLPKMEEWKIELRRQRRRRSLMMISFSGSNSISSNNSSFRRGRRQQHQQQQQQQERRGRSSSAGRRRRSSSSTRSADAEHDRRPRDRSNDPSSRRSSSSSQHHHHHHQGSFLQQQFLACAELAYAMDYLHERNIMHRDLKPENIGFAYDGRIQLFDFGLATKLEDAVESSYDRGQYQQTTLAGTYPYIAPEIALGKPYGLGVDVYSLSIVMWEMLSLRDPFENLKRNEYIDMIVHGGYRPKIDHQWCKSLQNLLWHCWLGNPQLRPSMFYVCDEMRDMILPTTTTTITTTRR